MGPTTNANAKVPELISRPFLLMRLIVFVLLLLLNVLIISFAAFNITASRTWGKFVGFGPSLAAFNSSVFLFVSMLLLGEREYSHAIPPVSMVLAEVCWTGVMATLTFVSSVLSTQQGPAKMCSSTPINLAMCSSSILILPVSWVNFLVFFVYSVTLLIVTILHAPLVPRIWYSNVSEIPWFAFPASSHDSDKADIEGRTVYGDAFRSAHSPEVEQQTLKPPPRAPWLTLPRGSLTISVASFTPAWAKEYNLGLTRGLHNPFNRSIDQRSTDRTLCVPSGPVQRPARVITKPVHEDRLHERDDDPFAALSRHDTVTTMVPGDYNDKNRSIQPLAGSSGLPQWSPVTTPATTPSEIGSRDPDTGKRGIGKSWVQNLLGRAPSTAVATTTEVTPSRPDRSSVSSLFPHDVREEDWNRPLTKPPFRNGRGEGWTTADAAHDTVPAGRGRGRR